MNDELEALKGDKKLPLRVIISRTLKYIRTERKSFLLALFLIALNVLLDTISPLFTSRITDELVLENINIRFVLSLVLLSFTITLINQIFLYVESTILQNCGQRIIYRLRNEIFEHIENMSLNQFNEMPTGSLVTRVTSYTASMSDLFTGVFVRILRDITTLVGVYIIMIYISPSLSFALSGVMVIVFVGLTVMLYIQNIVRSATAVRGSQRGSSAGDRRVVKMLVFYSDGRFEEFGPTHPS